MKSFHKNVKCLKSLVVSKNLRDRCFPENFAEPFRKLHFNMVTFPKSLLCSFQKWKFYLRESFLILSYSIKKFSFFVRLRIKQLLLHANSLVVIGFLILPIQHLLVKCQQWNHQIKVWNLLKVDNKDTKTSSLTSFWCLYCYLWIDFTLCFVIFVIDFQQLNAGWVGVSQPWH